MLSSEYTVRTKLKEIELDQKKKKKSNNEEN